MTKNNTSNRFPETSLTVNYLDSQSSVGPVFPIASTYVERFWLPVIGPTTTLLLRRLDAHLQRSQGEITIDSLDWSLALGLGPKGGRHSPYWRSIERACRFNLAELKHCELLILRQLPLVPDHHLSKFSPNLETEHRQITSSYQLQRT